MTSAMLESAFGTDFGLADYPAFKKSAVFRVLSNAPSGWYFNYSDCGDQRPESGDIIQGLNIWCESQSGQLPSLKHSFKIHFHKMVCITVQCRASVFTCVTNFKLYSFRVR